ncbi:hypothetical protein FS837_003456 [Tulasnella sp. UAMH 9824]|nr:hypothetical protein FS837_003456 [Tulasnella sp. UAMH 9824]
MTLGMVSMWSTAILVSKLTPILLNKISWRTYFIFGLTTLVGVLWAILLFPETGGYAIEDIHSLFEDVVKQSLHDNKYLLQRPPVRRGYTRLREEEEADSDGFEPTRASFDSASTVDRFS